MENNFTSTQHYRGLNTDISAESAGRTIAKMRERQKGKNFVYGVVITALALSTAILGIGLGTSNRYARDLRTKLDTANTQMTQMRQQYSANKNGTTGIGTYSSAANTIDGTADGTTAGSASSGRRTNRNWRGMRNWKNFNNTNDSITPARLPSTMDAGTTASTGVYTNYAGTGTGTYGAATTNYGTGSASNYGTNYSGNYSRTANTAGTASGTAM